MSILVEHLTKHYGPARAVEDISFSVDAGQIAGFLGPNGAGKSTTMKILAGCLNPDSGRAEVAGFDVRSRPLEVHRRIGYLPESNPLYPEMYVREYLGFHARLHGLGSKSTARINAVIEMTGLGPEQHKKIGSLSKGYRQRVGLSQALLHDPEVLILDEPTSGLDPNQLTEIRSLLRELGKDKTMLLSTHILQEVEALCDRVIIISAGRIAADSPVGALRQIQGREHRVTVEFSQAPPVQELEATYGAAALRQLGACSWEIRAGDPDQTRKKLMEFALRNNLNIVSLQSSSSSLEEIFRELTDVARPDHSS